MKTPTTLSKQDLSSIKHTLFDMLQSSGKLDEPDYESLAESLSGLSFKHYSINDFAVQVAEIIEEMIDLDDLGFDIGQLYKYQDKLK